MQHSNYSLRKIRLSNEKAIHALCQALSPSKFAKISNYELAKEAWQILETYEKALSC
jgi:hypothetical protein